MEQNTDPLPPSPLHEATSPAFLAPAPPAGFPLTGLDVHAGMHIVGSVYHQTPSAPDSLLAQVVNNPLLPTPSFHDSQGAAAVLAASPYQPSDDDGSRAMSISTSSSLLPGALR